MICKYFDSIINWILVYRVWKNDSKMPSSKKVMQLSCWPIRRMSGSKVIGSASSAVGHIHGKRILITTYHSIAKAGEWRIEMECDTKTMKSILRGFSQFNFVQKIMHSTGEVIQSDVAYAFIGDEYYSKLQYITKYGKIINSTDRIESDFQITNDPDTKQRYGFYGQIQPSKEEHFLKLGHIVHSGLTYLRKEDEYLVFNFPNKLRDECVYGCSGAPIIGEDGKTYGIVCFGKADKNELYCISIKQLSGIIQASILEITNPVETN